MAEKKANYHVIPEPTGWAVRRSGASKATKLFETQSDAVKYAREDAKKRNTDVYVHTRDGSISSRNSYSGTNPKPPKK